MNVSAMSNVAKYWADWAGRVDIPHGMWIDGGWVPAASSSPLVSPRNGRVIAEVAASSTEDVVRAVDGAATAFKTGVWARLSPRERGDALIRWADLLEQNRDELALLVSLEMGKPICHAWQIEMRTSIALIRWYGELADKLMDESPRGRHNSIALVTREPVGVVAVITPWNFPMTLACVKVPAALVAGNSVVLKPASQSPISILRAAELACEAGVPPGVFQVITGSGALTGRALAASGDVAALTFTGSTEVGQELVRHAGESNLKTVSLELGGKSPNILFPDAPDLDAALDSAAWAISFNSGQMCTAGSRLIVHESILDEVTAGVVKRLSAKRIGDPLDPSTEIGPLSSERHRQDVLRAIRGGIDSGAELVLGSDQGIDRPGFYVSPTVFAGVNPDSQLAQEEIFGPVLSVMSFGEEEQAIELANNSKYGLAAAVWTSDMQRVHRVSRAVDAGTVWVNCYEESDAAVPFGGRKSSGHGSDSSVHGMDKYTTLKTTWINL